MIFVTDAHYVDGYKIQISFNDHRQGIVDLSDVMRQDHRPIFNELLDTVQFKKFRVDADTLVWDNGLDLAPEFLYKRLS